MRILYISAINLSIMHRNLNDDIDFEVSKLISKYIAETISESELITLNEWLDQADNRSLFEKISSKEIMQQKIQAYKDSSVELHFENFVKRRKKKSIRKMWKRAMVAAAIFIPLLFVFNYFWPVQTASELTNIETEMLKLDGPTLTLSTNEQVSLEQGKHSVHEVNGKQILLQENQTIDYSAIGEARGKLVYNNLQVPVGYNYSLILSDGTKVWLNAMSSLRYPVAFAKHERIVEATGEIYFEVKRDVRRPFFVNINGVKVEVTGTQFNVHSYADEDYTQITLAEGAVNIHTAKGMTPLTPGKQLTWYTKSQSATVKSVKMEEYIAWKDGVYTFKYRKLEEVLRVAQRWFGVNFIYENESAKTAMYTGALFKQESLDDFLNRLEATSKYKFRKQGDRVFVN